MNLADPNGKIDPTKQLLLNPSAWTECGPTVMAAAHGLVSNDPALATTGQAITNFQRFRYN